MGALMPEPEKQKNIKIGIGNGLKYCSAEMQGWRESMEDTHIHQLNIAHGNSLFAVFDGHGGYEVSRYVKEIFISTLTQLSSYKEKQYQKSLRQCFKLIDEKILSDFGEKRLKQICIKSKIQTEQISHQTGCTANVILITENEYFIANIGDSRSVMLSGNQTIQLSYDHKPQRPQQKNRILEAGGSIISGRVNCGLNLSRAFGDFVYKQNDSLPYDKQIITCDPEIKVLKRSIKDKFIIMGCDGIWEKYQSDSSGLVKYIQQLGQTFSEKYQPMLEQMMEDFIAVDTSESIGMDNMTAILIGLNKQKK